VVLKLQRKGVIVGLGSVLRMSVLGLAIVLPGARQAVAAAPSGVNGAQTVGGRIPDTYISALRELPDWNGSWTQDWQGGPWLMFDPLNAHAEPDPSTSQPTGITPGNYLSAIPLKPEAKREYMESVSRQKAGESLDTVAGGCRPYGMPRVMFGNPFGPEIIVTPEIVVMLEDVDKRIIYTDGRQHPTGDDAIDTWDGHSIGHWEGDTLVVDTVNVFPGNYDQSNAMHSGKIHIVERIRLLDKDTLQVHMVIEDPETLEHSWTVVRQYKRGKIKWPNRSYTNCGLRDDIDLSEGFQSVILPSEAAARKADPLPGGGDGQ